MGVAISIQNVTKRFGNDTIIDGLSLDILPGEFFTLLGPSGCGKTTLLRMVIGFNSIEGGQIAVDGKVVNQIPTSKRNMGMVFQNYAVFPHMSVRENVAYGLKTRKLPKEQIRRQVDEILRVVKIDQYAERMAANLSGGQQQRVALARAIVIRPDVLLMDEPLSNLDAKLRIEMRNAIKKIQRQVGITTLYVTHDQEEALAISDRIAVMNGGAIQQIGTPKYIYQRPANLFVSTFIGLTNVLEGQVLQRAERKFLELYGCRVPADNLRDEAYDGQQVSVSVRPEEWMMVPGEGPGISAVVRSSVFLGVNLHYFLELEDGKEIELITPSDLSEIVPDDTRVRLRMVHEKINVFDRADQKTLIREGV